MQRRDLDEIAEHVVVADLQRLDAGRLGISRLQAGDDLAAAVAQAPMLVEIGVGAVADEAAVARIDAEASRRAPPTETARSARGAAARRSTMPISSRGSPSASPRAQELRGKGVRRSESHRATAPRSRGPPRPSASRASARARSGAGLQRFAQIVPQARLVGEIGDRIEPRVQRRRIGQRTAEPARQLARAGRGDGAVDGGKQAPGARALVRAHQLEIGARGGIDDEKAAGASLCAADGAAAPCRPG